MLPLRLRADATDPLVCTELGPNSGERGWVLLLRAVAWFPQAPLAAAGTCTFHVGTMGGRADHVS